MTVLSVEIPEKLVEKLKRTGRPAQEVIVEALERALNGTAFVDESAELARPQTAHPLAESNPDYTSTESQPMSQQKRRKPLQQNLSREEVIQRLLEAGLIRAPESWDNEYARAWRERPEEEKKRLIQEMQETFFPDSFASKWMIENRR